MKRTVVIVILLVLLTSGFVFLLIYSNKKGVSLFGKDNSYEEYKAGDVVTIQDDEWYVLYDSSKEDDYVTLISDRIFYEPSIPYVFNEIYETSSLRKYLEKDFVKEYLEDVTLVEKSGYKIRLLDMDDFNKVEYSYDKKEDKYVLKDCPDYVCLHANKFSTMIDTSDVNIDNEIYTDVNDIENPEYDKYKIHLKYYNVNAMEDEIVLESISDDASLFIRPIINVDKKSLEG